MVGAGRETAQQPGVPASAREEFRRGWTVLIGALLCYIVSVVAVPTTTYGIYLKVLPDALNVSRSTFTTGSLLPPIIMTLMSPLVGLFADRYGVRTALAISTVGMAVVYALMGSVMNSFPTYLLLTAALLFVGSATLPVIFTRAVNSWFDQARGLALGCVLVGTGFTAMGAPPLVAWTIEHHGWQASYLVIAAIVLAAAPAIVALVRLPPWDPAKDNPSAPSNSGMTLGEAIGTGAFWLIALGFFLQATAAMGLNMHMVAMLTDEGMTLVAAARIASIIGAAIICGRFLIGVLLDRFFAPHVAVICAVMFAAGCGLLLFGGVRFAALFAFTTGFVIGAEVDFIGYLASRYFGLRHYGRIYGCLYSAFVLGGGVSAFWVGQLQERTGDYRAALWVAIALMGVVATLLLLLPRYHSPSGKPGASVSV
jgi:MFS family permease